MSTLHLFSLPNFMGDSATLHSDTPDLSSYKLLQRAKSLKVQGYPWIVFSDVNYGYKGSFQPYTAGDYPTIPGWENKISSCRLVKGGFFPHQITLYEGTNHAGTAVPLEQETDALEVYFPTGLASSQKDVKGAWILYSKKKFDGDQMVTVTGDNIPDYSNVGWGGKVASLKPITG